MWLVRGDLPDQIEFLGSCWEPAEMLCSNHQGDQRCGTPAARLGIQQQVPFGRGLALCSFLYSSSGNRCSRFEFRKVDFDLWGLGMG